MPDSSDTTSAALVAHLAKAFPGGTPLLRPATAHAREVVPALEIAHLAPASPSEPWVYATVGAWRATEEQGLRYEFYLLSPREDDRHLETLSSVAYFHSFYGLDPGSVYRVARGWFFDSLCDRFLFTSPTAVTGHDVKFLRCLPITADEADFAKTKGQQALEAKFASKKTNLLDPKRASVV